jgi:hypothetical protein
MIGRAVVILLSVLFVALTLAGAISYLHGLPDDGLWIEDNVTRARLDAGLIRGRIHLVYSRPLQGPSVENESGAAGFYCRTRTIGNTLSIGLGGPFWAPALLLGLGPALWGRRVLLRRSRRRGQRCVACGYSLTGLADPRCPECGTPVSPVQSTCT